MKNTRFERRSLQDTSRHVGDNTARDNFGYSQSMYGGCSAVIGSMTGAMRAQDALSEAAIRSSVTKFSSGETGGGCAYGVTYPCSQSREVRYALERARIKVRKFYG